MWAIVFILEYRLNAVFSKVAVTFQIPATQLPESYTRMKVDCLHDRQSMHKTLFAAVMGLVAIISAIFKMVLL
jgi:hypothetical protein